MDNLDFFDAISIASREEIEQKFDEQTRVLLEEISKKLDLIVELLTREKGDFI